jgi:hypothetical protein
MSPCGTPRRFAAVRRFGRVECGGDLALAIARRQPMASRQRDDPFPVRYNWKSLTCLLVRSAAHRAQIIGWTFPPRKSDALS